MREPPEFIVPHSEYGDPECCGLILAHVRGDEADLVCNECGKVMGDCEIAFPKETFDRGFA
jgi:hypothetical protein